MRSRAAADITLLYVTMGCDTYAKADLSALSRFRPMFGLNIVEVEVAHTIPMTSYYGAAD